MEYPFDPDHTHLDRPMFDALAPHFSINPQWNPDEFGLLFF